MADQDDNLPFGLYERLITASLKARLLRFDSATKISTQGLDPAEAHATLARHIEDVAARALKDLPQDDRAAKQAELVNDIIRLLTGAATPKGVAYESHDDIVEIPPEQLLSIQPITGVFAHDRDTVAPLSVHARHSLVEIFSAFGRITPGQFYQHREGTYRDQATNSDLFFVTLEKSERDYSPSTLYKDYAISPTLFHWESQSTTSQQSPTGQRYIRHRELGGNNQDQAAAFAIDTLELLGGGLPVPQRRLVEAWAELHRAELLEDWTLLHSGQPPVKIDPLT